MITFIFSMLHVKSTDDNILERFMYAFTREDSNGDRIIDFEKIEPIPSQLRFEELMTGLKTDQWKMNNWGTTSKAIDILDISNKLNKYYFSTSHTAPIQAMIKLSEICKGIELILYTIEYREQIRLSSRANKKDGIATIYRFLDGVNTSTTKVDDDDFNKVYKKVTKNKLDKFLN